MKLRGRIMTLLITPIVLFGVIIFLVCAIKITGMTNEIIENDLHASALAGRSMLKNSGGMMDAFKLDENGDMFNGDKNITMNTGNADSIKKASGIDTVVFFGDTRKMSTIKRADGSREENSQASAAVISAVLENGQEYFTQHDNIGGNEYYSYYVPLFNSLNPDKPIGMIAAGKSCAKVQKELLAILTWIFLATVVLVAAAIAVGLFFIKRICRRIAYGVNVVEQVSGGQLYIELDPKYLHSKDEIGDILRAIEKLKDGLYGIVKDILDLSVRVQNASDGLMERANLSSTHISQVDTAVTEIAQGATSQAEETQNTTDNVVRMGNMLEKNNSEVDVLNENAKQMIETGNQAISILSELESINDKTRQAVDVISEQTNTTNESAQKIREAINLITDIAEETNLLSLNASIEAARAGEQGRGFAVVASQIQKLAEQSNESAHKIEMIVSSLIEDSHKAVDAMEEVKDIIDEQSDMVSKTGDMFEELKHGIDSSVSSVNVIAESTKVIEEARTNVVDAVQNLTSIAEENAASTEETAAAVTEISEIVRQIAIDSDGLEKISGELEAKIAFFHLGEEAPESIESVTDSDPFES